MASLAENTARVVNGLDNIKKTITNNGCVVSPDTPIESYPELIDNACALNSEQGYNKGFNDGSEVSYSEGYAVGNEAGLKYGEQIGTEKGKQAQYDEFKNFFTGNGTRGVYVRAFASRSEYLPLPYLKGATIQPTNAYQMFYGTYDAPSGDLQQMLDDNDITIDFSKCEVMQYCFGNTNFTRIGVVDTSSATTISQLFFSSSKLITVDKLIPNETQPYSPYAFQGCYALKNIEIEGAFGKDVNFKDCPLSKESILSIFNALSPMAEGMTLTLKKTAVNTAFGIDVDDATTYSDEWKSLTESKKNWNIAYA